MMTPKSASPKRKLNMPLALRSCCSNSVSGFCPGSMCSSLMCRFQNLGRMRVMQRQQWPLLQVAEEQCQPETTNCERQNNVPNGHVKSFMESRFDHPEQVHATHKNQPNGQPDQLANIAFQLTRKQQYEGHSEVK